MFLRCFLHSSLVNLLLLASLEEKSTHRVLGCFLGAGDGDDLEEEFLVDGATRGVFALFWEAVAVMNLFLRVGSKNNSCIRETQENSIEFLVQSSLPYIRLLMICAHYCAPYPK